MPIVAVASGEAHTLFLSGYGDVFACGRGREGQLGLGQKFNEAAREPRPLEALRPHHIARIACGGKHCVAVSSEGRAFEWGMLLSLEKVADTEWANRRGGLGKDFQEDLNQREQRIVASSWKRYLKNSGEAGPDDDSGSEEDGSSSLRAFERAECRRFAVHEPRPCAGLEGVGGTRAAACGFAHTVLAVEGGGMLAAGYGEKGQLGNGERFPSACFLAVSLPAGARAAAAEEEAESSRPLRAAASRSLLACGHNHVAAVVQPDGRLFSWGLGVFGQLGLGHAGKERCLPAAVKLPGRVVQVACGDHHTLALIDSGELFTFGHRDAVGGQSHHERLPERMEELSQVERLFAGGTGCFAVARGPQESAKVALQAWGYNQHACLGRSLAELQMLFPGPVALPRPTELQLRALGVGGGHCVLACEVPSCCVLPPDTAGPFLGCTWLRAALLGEPPFDVQVCAGVGGRDLLGAHREVLSARCPPLAARLRAAAASDEQPWLLDLGGWTPACVTALLEYLYTDFCRPSPDAAAELRPLAEAHGLSRLAAGLASAGEKASMEDGARWVRKEGGGWRQVREGSSEASPAVLPESRYETDLQALVVEGETQAPGYVVLAIREEEDPTNVQLLSVARIVLVAVDFFRALLEGGFAESQRMRECGEGRLEVSADSAEALTRCLRLLATGRLEDLRRAGPEEVLAVLVEAHRLCLPEIVDAAADALSLAAAAGRAPEGLADVAALYGLPRLAPPPVLREAWA